MLAAGAKNGHADRLFGVESRRYPTVFLSAMALAAFVLFWL